MPLVCTDRQLDSVRALARPKRWDADETCRENAIFLCIIAHNIEFKQGETRDTGPHTGPLCFQEGRAHRTRTFPL
jgi:hypothetical protein